MALSAWSVMIKLNSTSNLPKQLGAISSAMRATGKDAAGLTKEIDGLDARIRAMNAPLVTHQKLIGDVGTAYRGMAAAASGFGAGAIASGAAAERATRSLAKYAAVAAIAGGGFGGGPRAPLALSGGGGGGRGTSFFGRGFSGGAPRNPGFWGWSSGLGVGAPPPGGGAPPGGGGGGGGGGIPLGGVPGFIANTARRAAMWGATAGTAAGVDAISSAASMQRAMLGIQNASGASDAQINALRQSAFNVGDLTGMTAAKSADLFAVIARSSGGVFNKRNGDFDMGGFMAVAPTIAEIARIQTLTRGVDTDHAAQTVVQLMHLFRTYSGAPMAKTGDLLTRLSELMPDSLDTAMKQFAYFLPSFKAMGISDKDSVATMALLDRMGYGRGKGGTNISDLIGASIGGLQLTSHAQKGKDALLQQIGVVDSAGNSKFFTDKGANLIGFLQQLNKFASENGRTATIKDFKSAFGVQGSRIADLALDPQFVKQIGSIEQVMNNPHISLLAQFGAYGRSADQQIARGLGNTQSVLTEIGWQLLPGVTLGFKLLGDKMHEAQIWLHTHKKAEDDIRNAALAMGRAVGPALDKLGWAALRLGRDLDHLYQDFQHLHSAWAMITNPKLPGWTTPADGNAMLRDAIARQNGAPSPFPYNGPQIGRPTALATGGHIKGAGLAYLHPNEVVVNDRVTRHVERALSGGRRSGGTTTIRLEIASNGTSQFDGMSQRDLKRLARSIADVLGSDVELDSRSGGATPQLVGASHYSIGQGKVS